jgi:ATP-dependent DNA helicase DinG
MDTTNHPLGHWAVIDLETSGIDPLNDSIIDVGFLQFNGTELVRSYSSLVQTDVRISQFIKELTGISQSMVNKAPSWNKVKLDVEDLEGHTLIAHNADFEKSFLDKTFKDLKDVDALPVYSDTIYWLGLIFPDFGRLGLETFIQKWNLRDSEVHRGLEDSIDLLKVVILTYQYMQDNPKDLHMLKSLFYKHQLHDDWFFKFLLLETNEVEDISSAIEFCWEEYLPFVFESLKGSGEEFKKTSLSFEKEFSGKNIQTILQSEEEIKEVFPHYKFRQTQLDLSQKVGQSFKHNVHTLVQAPTGTGKTLGYLIPSALYAMNGKSEDNGQVLIATGTKTLQNQAMTEDVPKLRKLLNIDQENLKVSSLVGSKNHFCELLFWEEDRQTNGLELSENFGDSYTKLFFEYFFHTNGKRKTPLTRLDMPYVLKMKMAEFKEMDQDLAVDFRACTGGQCPYKGNCSYLLGLRNAKDSQLIIGNHALLFYWPRGVPRPGHIVVDEAHKLEREATNSFTFEVAQSDLEKMGNNLMHLQGLGSLFYLLAQTESTPGESTPVIKKIREEAIYTANFLTEHLGELPRDMESFFMKKPRYTSQYWNELPMINMDRTKDSLSVKIYHQLESILNILMQFNDVIYPFQGRWEKETLKDENQIVAWGRFEAFMGTWEDLLTSFKKVFGVGDNYTHSLKYHAEIGFSLVSSPVDIGRVVHDQLLETSESVVFTSATLANSDGNSGVKGIEWATGHLYLDPKKRFKQGLFLKPHFDIENKTKVFLCDDVPPMWDNVFVQSVLTPVMRLIRNIKGRSLLLFSAKTRFEEAREHLLKEFSGEIPLFIQGMGSNIIDDFKNSPSGILLGMESFGEGIDIPGKALEFVFIDKVPDLSMDLVINDRRDFYEKNIGNEFTDYYLGQRTRSLHQKLGRLLRSENDRGAAIIVDARTKKWKGRTMEKVIELMRPYPIQRSDLLSACEEVENYILGSE